MSQAARIRASRSRLSALQRPRGSPSRRGARDVRGRAGGRAPGSRRARRAADSRAPDASERSGAPPRSAGRASSGSSSGIESFPMSWRRAARGEMRAAAARQAQVTPRPGPRAARRVACGPRCIRPSPARRTHERAHVRAEERLLGRDELCSAQVSDQRARLGAAVEVPGDDAADERDAEHLEAVAEPPAQLPGSSSASAATSAAASQTIPQTTTRSARRRVSRKVRKARTSSTPYEDATPRARSAIASNAERLGTPGTRPGTSRPIGAHVRRSPPGVPPGARAARRRSAGYAETASRAESASNRRRRPGA